MSGNKKQVRMIRCERPDDVIVVRPGPNAESVVQDLIHIGKSKGSCGHPHKIVVGKLDFISVEAFGYSTESIVARVTDAYENNPLAKVFADTVCDQLGIERNLIHATPILGHPRLLAILAEANAVQKARVAATPMIHKPMGLH